jgi:L-amino acid N-acyltransferase YncA
MSDVLIREFRQSDLEKLCDIFDEVTSTGDTYDFAADTSRDVSKNYFTAKDVKCFVAECNGEVVGMYVIKPNRPGNAAHIANCSYMVTKKFRERGIGEALGNHSIRQAELDGFRAIQFNFVVSTNIAAVNLWKKLGFKIIGTIPEAFHNVDLDYVDAYIMFKKL